MLYNLYLLSLPITFAFSLYAYKQLDNYFKWFMPYLAFVIVYEAVNYWGLMNWQKSNAWCNNLEGLLELVLFTYFLASLVRSEKYRKTVYRLLPIPLLFSLIDIIYIQGFFNRATIAIVIQGLFLLALICVYYRSLFKEADESLNLFTHPPFLAATGFLFFFLSNTFFYACFSYMIFKSNYHFYLLAASIPGISNLLLNALLIRSFLCAKNNSRQNALAQ